MFIVLVHYRKSLELIDKYLVEHRAFLAEGYEKNYFVVSGPRNPRTGGVIISQLSDKVQLEHILARDPFFRHELADYEIIEFTPVKYHPEFANFLSVGSQ